MNVFIIHAHPEPKSYSSALKDTALNYFENSGNKVIVSDLYKMKFNPVGDKNDFKKLSAEVFFKYQTEQVNASKNDLFSDEIKIEMEKLLWADLVIFNFPMWWFSVPAIMKGWVDRIFAMGFSYGAGKGVYAEGIFKTKKGMLCVTTGGPESAFKENGRNGDIDKILFPINHGILYFVGMQTLPYFIVYGAARLNEVERETKISEYETHLSKIKEMNILY